MKKARGKRRKPRLNRPKSMQFLFSNAATSRHASNGSRLARLLYSGIGQNSPTQ